jgi:hypothetical protein
MNHPEKELTGQESLALIAKMINKAKRDYLDSGLSSLLWGSVIMFCSLVTYANNWLKWPNMDYVWFLTIGAVIPQILIAIREGKARKHRSYDEDLMSGIWIAFGITMFVMGYIFSRYPSEAITSLYLAIYGIPTFAVGYARRFRPMLYGGVACWILAIYCLYCGYPNTLLCLGLGALLAWFIPGLILRNRYLKAKAQHV